jgi:hypothetical protein
VNGEVITSYTRGDVSNAGDYFILRLPIDSVDPQDAGTVRPGDVAGLFLDADTDAAQTITVGERGTIQRIFLPGTPVDTDMDGIEDVDDNCPDTANDLQADADNDGQGDACDGDSDTDGDGYTDMVEYNNLHNGDLDPDGVGFDPTVYNAPGGPGYTGTPGSKSLIPILFLLLHDDAQGGS